MLENESITDMAEEHASVETLQDEPQTSSGRPQDEEVTPSTIAKLLLFLLWWFSGIGVGTAFISPSVIGTSISTELFMTILLAHFCSVLLITVLLPGPDDDTLDSGVQGLFS